MAKENVSPEERLFNIIQKSKKANSTGEYNDKSDKLKLNLESIGLLKRLITYRIKQAFGGFKNKFMVEQGSMKALSLALPIRFYDVDLKVINKLLTILISVLVATSIYYVVSGKPNVSRIANMVSGIKVQAVKGKDIETLKPLNFYADEVRKRNIFSAVSSEPAGGRAEFVASGLQEVTKNLSLVGIYMGMYPEAMIEDKTEKKTYFLKQGNEIKGVKLKEILPDRIILEYKGEEMEFM